MDQYKYYLATNVLNEGQVVTYRSLSRALKVNVNLAKRMLFDFHKTQNEKQNKSVHATYVVSGLKRQEVEAPAKDGDDTIMNSSPFPSSYMMSSAPQVTPGAAVRTMSFAREEELQELTEQYDEITSIHIYSLEPTSPQDINVIAMANEALQRSQTNSDPLADFKIYGTIYNPYVKRRKNHPTAAEPTNKTTLPPSESTAAAVKSVLAPPAAAAARPSKPAAAPAPAGAKPAAKPPASAGALFSSFAKTRPPKPGAKKSALPEPKKPAAPDADEDVAYHMSSEDDDGEEDEAAAAAAARPAPTTGRSEARAAREAKLRAMMDDEDDGDEEEESDDSEPPAAVDADGDATMADSPPATSAAVPAPKDEGGKEKDVTTTGGKRRGKRRVTKKKTFVDADGYLVTREEAEWESFEEDEPVEAKRAKVGADAGKQKPGAAGGGTAPKKQGNITSFFAKR